MTTGDGSQDRGRNPVPVNADKASADSRAFGYCGGGDAGRGRVEHRSFLGWVHSLNCKKQVIPNELV
ncbi:MAG: hypothetical protein GF309_09995 [Candidatus Lokiarchaeota archaeon]|nr:hypothetical protein [Candidatus Lokiarchaeota archaeon]